MPRSFVLTSALGWIVWVAPAAAQSVTFDQALALGDRTPPVEGSERALRARERGDADIGGTLDETNVIVMPGALLAPEELRGFDMQLNATQGWNLADLGRVRRRAASQERRAIAAQIRAVALSARIEAARRWIELWTLEQLEQLLEEQRDLLGRSVDLTERALQAGVATATDRADALATAAEVEQRRLTLEGARFDAATQLAAAIGWASIGRASSAQADAGRDQATPRGAGPSVAGSRGGSGSMAERGHRATPHAELDVGILVTSGPPPRPRLPALPEIRERIDSLESMPEVVMSRLSETAARTREAEASAEYAPVLHVGAQLERDPLDTWLLYGVAQLSLRAFGQANRDVSLAREEAVRAAQQVREARVRARAELVAAAHEVIHARRRVLAVESRLLPALVTLRERRERALAVGEGTVFEVLIARRRELLGREELVRAEGARTWAEVRMWLLLAELERAESG